MQRIRPVIGALLAGLWVAPLAAQQPTGTVRGLITDAASREPLSGVTVTVGARGAVSQPNGRFVVTGVPAGTEYTLSARMIGYAPISQVVRVTSGQTMDVDLTMTAAAINLAEMVVVGYGEQRAGDLPISFDKVSSDAFNPGRIVAPAELIQSKIAGVQVVDNNEPGGGLSIRVRGTTSINAGSEPLYVIDGVPVGEVGPGGGGISAGRDPLNFLNPSDIQDITVLRDAAATAIYGANGSSGVVLITTKQGRRGGPQFEYSTNFSTSSVTKTPDMLNAAEFRTAVQTYAPASYLTQLGTANNNWFDLVTRTGYGQEHNLSVSGAGESNSWRVSAGYLTQNGIVRNSSTERLALGLNYSQRLFHDRIDVRTNLRGSRTFDRFQASGYGAGSVLASAANMGPTQPVFDTTNANSTTGYYEWPNNSLTSADNPMALLALVKSDGRTYRSIGNAQIGWRMPVLGDALSAHLNLGYDITDVATEFFAPSTTHPERKTGYNGELALNNNSAANSVLETYLTYAAPARFISGNLELTGGYSYAQSHAQYTSLYERGLNTDLLGPNGVPTASTVSNTSPIVESRLISFFGRANYNLNDRYLLALSLRRDGSSRFGVNNAWGVFPAVAFAWRLSQEPLFSSIPSLSDLKLRLSWGKTGNQAFGDYLQYASYLYSNPQAQVQFGNTFVTTIRPGAYNPDLKWEATASTNVGLDFGFHNQRFTGAIDWYDKKTEDMIFTVPVAQGTNLSNFVTKNIGSMRNRGIELTLHARMMEGGRRGLSWNADFTVGHNSNTVLTINPSDSVSQILVGGISGGVGNTVQVLKPGYAVNSFFLCRQVYDAQGKPVQNSFYALDGTTVVTGCTNNRVPEHSPQPSLILGHSSYFTYGDLDFSFTLRAYLGNYVYNNVASQYGDYRELFAGTSPYNLHRSVLTTGFTQAQYLSDYYLEKASFLRLDNVTVGYTFNYRSQPVRVYLTAQNLFTRTGYSGVDPTAGINGIDNNIYPRSRTFSGGMTVRF